MLQERSIPVAGRLVRYWETNPDSTQTVVMVHGFRGNHHGLAGVADRLPGFRAILPDRPGCGGSEPMAGRHTVHDHARWLDDFLVALRLPGFITWGHSSGASIAMIHAATGTRKPSAVVCVTPAVTRRDPLSWATTAYYRSSFLLPTGLRRKWLTSGRVERFGDRFLFRDPDARRAWKRQRDADRPTLRPDAMCEEYFSVRRLDLARYVARVETPMLLVGGTADVVVPHRRLCRLAASMPVPRLVLLPGRGHLMPVEDPATVAGVTLEYLAQLAGPALPPVLPLCRHFRSRPPSATVA